MFYLKLSLPATKQRKNNSFQHELFVCSFQRFIIKKLVEVYVQFPINLITSSRCLMVNVFNLAHDADDFISLYSLSLFLSIHYSFSLMNLDSRFIVMIV